MFHDVSNHVIVDGAVDAVMHLASPASPKDFTSIPIKILKVGSLGTHNLLGLARAKGARFFLASTSEVYGDPLVHPQPETYWGNVNPIGPRGVYDEAKRFAEAMTMAYHRAARRRRPHRADLQHLRAPHAAPTTGGSCPTSSSRRSRGRPLTVYGDGSQTRSFTYVDDEIRGFLALLDSDYVGPVNIGNPDEVTIRQLADLVLELTGSDVAGRAPRAAGRRPHAAPARHLARPLRARLGARGPPPRGAGPYHRVVPDEEVTR